MWDAMTNGGMMWGMGLFGWFCILVVALVAAALIKYIVYR